MADRLIDDNGVTDFIDDNGEVQFYDDVGNYTWAIGATASSLAFTAAPNPTSIGVSVTLTGSVTPSIATKIVVFSEGPTVLGVGLLSGGTTSIAVSFSTNGSHVLTALYVGSPTYASSSNNVTVQVGGVIPPLAPTGPLPADVIFDLGNRHEHGPYYGGMR